MFVVVRQATAHQEPVDPRQDGRQHFGDIHGIEVRQGMEPPTFVNTPVQYQRVEVDVQIQRPAEALDDDHRAPARVTDASLTRPVTQEPQDRAHGHGHHFPTRVMVPGQHVSHSVWEREHPLAHGDVGEHMIDEVLGALGHPATAAARTDRSGLARKRDQPVGATGATAKAGEAPREPPTAQEVAKLLLDEPGHPLAVALVPRLREERLEVIADDCVEHAPVGLARLVDGRRRSHGVDVRMDRAARNPLDYGEPFGIWEVLHGETPLRKADSPGRRSAAEAREARNQRAGREARRLWHQKALWHLGRDREVRVDDLDDLIFHRVTHEKRRPSFVVPVVGHQPSLQLGGRML